MYRSSLKVPSWIALLRSRFVAAPTLTSTVRSLSSPSLHTRRIDAPSSDTGCRTRSNFAWGFPGRTLRLHQEIACRHEPPQKPLLYRGLPCKRAFLCPNNSDSSRDFESAAQLIALNGGRVAGSTSNGVRKHLLACTTLSQQEYGNARTAARLALPRPRGSLYYLQRCLRSMDFRRSSEAKCCR